MSRKPRIAAGIPFFNEENSQQDMRSFQVFIDLLHMGFKKDKYAKKEMAD